MLFRPFKQDNTRPAVKKVSELINPKSHKQKKYISLMLVPSYSTGKTRSLRIPRAAFYGIIVTALVISAVFTGLYYRSTHFERAAQNLSDELDYTQQTFNEFQQTADQIQNDLIDSTVQMYEQLTEEQLRAQRELERQSRRHQYALDDIWDHIDEIERKIGEMKDGRREIFDNLGVRAIIPPVAELMRQLEASQAALIDSFEFENNHTPAERATVPAVGLMGTAQSINPEDYMLDHLTSMLAELELQRILFDDLKGFSRLMEPYLLNFPTLWPVRAQINSGFGWRRCPFGGSRSEHHNGVDLPIRSGTPIRAAGGGTVVFSGWQTGYGNTIIINHGGGITTKYAHNSRNLVEVGRQVERGEIIANVGSTGRSTGPHVHYEVHINGNPVNPVPFLLEHHS